MNGYSASEVAGLLGLPVRRVRSFVRSGLIRPARGPRRVLRFSFQDLVVLRAAKGLLDARISPVRVRRVLEKLAQNLPEGRSLAGLTIAAEGSRVVVRKEGERFDPEDGQLLFDFEVAELVREVEPLVRRAARATLEERDHSAEEWYEAGLHLEIAAPEEAADAYRRALELDPRHVGSRVNLGRLLHEKREFSAAEAHYRSALEAQPDSSTAAFNLAVVLEDSGRTDEAVGVYERLIKRDALCADAHYNLARLYEKSGRQIAALKHLNIYERLARDH